MANETPSRPPPFMANAILNFHFDFPGTSLTSREAFRHREKSMAHATSLMFWSQFCKGICAIRHVSQAFDDISLHFQQQQKVLSSALIPLLCSLPSVHNRKSATLNIC